MIQIKHRYTRVVIFEHEGPAIKDAVIAAVLARADLAGANLAGADLTRAYLARADLAGANLAGADLTGADLASASHYDPSTHIEPKEPYAHKPQRTLAERAADYRARHPGVPVIERLDAKILAVLDAGKGTLDMKNWHSCETTHCRAGWAIHLAGPAGYKLEQELGDPAMAGRAIYRASTGRSPHFYADDKAATEDMRRCAAEDAMTVAPDVGSLAAEETKS